MGLRVQHEPMVDGLHFRVHEEGGALRASVEAEEDVASVVLHYQVRGETRSKGMAFDIPVLDAIAEAWLEARAAPIARRKYEEAKARQAETLAAYSEAADAVLALDEDARRVAHRYGSAADKYRAAQRATAHALRALEALGEEVDD
jgi:hypothetical protein